MAIARSAKAKFEVYVTDAFVDVGPITVTLNQGIGTEDITHLQSTLVEMQSTLDDINYDITGHVDLANTGYLALKTAAETDGAKTIATNDGTYSMKFTLEDESTAVQLPLDTLVTNWTTSRDAKGLPTYSCTLHLNTAAG